MERKNKKISLTSGQFYPVNIRFHNKTRLLLNIVNEESEEASKRQIQLKCLKCVNKIHV